MKKEVSPPMIIIDSEWLQPYCVLENENKNDIVVSIARYFNQISSVLVLI